jgi:hypothetical protein
MLLRRATTLTILLSEYKSIIMNYCGCPLMLAGETTPNTLALNTLSGN